MASRIPRFSRLLALRERELEEQKRLVAKAEQALREATVRVQEGQEALRKAATGFRVAPGESRLIQDFEVKSDWLKATVQALEKLMEQRRFAEERVRAQKGAQMKAERERRKIELLLEKIREEERIALVRAEQKDTDEVAQAKLSQLRDARSSSR